jgi:very-short-patch-repair endonuclease
VARKQLGVFSRAQAQACGYSAYQIRRRIADGEWQLVLGTGLALAGLKITPMVRDRAAQLSVPGSVLGAYSAARTWQLSVPDEGSYLYVGPHGASRVAGVRLIYDMPRGRDICLFQGMPTLNRPAAIVDCLAALGRQPARTLLDRSLQQGWLTVDELVCRTVARVGRRGTPQLRSLLDGVVGGERSAGERRLTELLRAARITGWEANAEIRDGDRLIGVGDVVFASAKLVVEVDGLAFHVTPERFQRDRQRQNRLVAAGWTVLRFTWRDLTERPSYVVASVRRLTQG